ncbi:hypothetical protein BDK51DRAFT_48764 [Blyttiomyces helicus]|uniref:Galactose oxidase n=1 Tax=Blyttiomyces helicus TaxID=388810 RepID=A0A4P9VY69_9FUNG|nr:hypothetical protein BDK51DRAFT_48764 [Blyttiomyces helicus]|eukprot:RKO84721.1 hypothetical protein BDK51DRAFT_48764 [Blyttiomyces helicus]
MPPGVGDPPLPAGGKPEPPLTASQTSTPSLSSSPSGAPSPAATAASKKRTPTRGTGTPTLVAPRTVPTVLPYDKPHPGGRTMALPSSTSFSSLASAASGTTTPPPSRDHSRPSSSLHRAVSSASAASVISASSSEGVPSPAHSPTPTPTPAPIPTTITRPPTNVAAMHWSRITPRGRALPGPLRAHTMVCVGDRLLLFGGCDPKVCYADLHVFDAESLYWTKIRAGGQVPEKCRAHSAVVIGRLVYVFGG